MLEARNGRTPDVTEDRLVLLGVAGDSIGGVLDPIKELRAKSWALGFEVVERVLGRRAERSCGT